MSFADTQAATFGPVPFQQQPRKVRKAYSYDYRRKQARWARKRPSDSAAGSSSWGARDEGRALNRYRGGGGGWDYDYAPRRRSRRRRSGGGNKYWSAGAWAGGRGGRSRRPKAPWYSRPRRGGSRRRMSRSLGSFFVPRSCRTGRSRFKAAIGMVETRYSPRRLRAFPRQRRSRLVGGALSQLSAYCSALRPARGRRRKGSGGGRRSRRSRRR